MGVMPNINGELLAVIVKKEFFITHAKVKMLAELTKEILIDAQKDTRETKEILAEDVAKLQIVQFLVGELLDVAEDTIQEIFTDAAEGGEESEVVE